MRVLRALFVRELCVDARFRLRGVETVATDDSCARDVSVHGHKPDAVDERLPASFDEHCGLEDDHWHTLRAQCIEALTHRLAHPRPDDTLELAALPRIVAEDLRTEF